MALFHRQNDYNVQKSRSSTALGNETVGDFKALRTPEHHHLQKSSTTAAMQSATISELRAKLQHSGDNEWRKRTPRLNSTNEELNMLKVKNVLNVSTIIIINLPARRHLLRSSSI